MRMERKGEECLPPSRNFLFHFYFAHATIVLQHLIRTFFLYILYIDNRSLISITQNAILASRRDSVCVLVAQAVERLDWMLHPRGAIFDLRSSRRLEGNGNP